MQAVPGRFLACTSKAARSRSAWTRVVETGTRESGVVARFSRRAKGLQRRRRGRMGARGTAPGSAVACRSPRSGARRVLQRHIVKVTGPRNPVLRRGLAAVDLPQGDRRRRLGRLGRDNGLHGSPRGLAGIVDDLAPLVIGRDPRPVEAVYWDLYRATRQSPGSVIAKALAGIENALLDLKARALGVPVYELFEARPAIASPMYWSHCGTTRARAWEVTRTPKLGSYDDVAALGREVVEHGYSAFKTNVVLPGDEPKVLMPGFNEGGGTLQAAEITSALVRLLEAFRAGTEGAARPIVDLNFNLEPEAASGSPGRWSPSTYSGWRSTCSIRARSRMSGTSRRCPSARERTCTGAVTSGGTSRRAEWTSPRLT